MGSQWLENCLEREQKLQEDQYSLKPREFDETNFLEWLVQIHLTSVVMNMLKYATSFVIC